MIDWNKEVALKNYCGWCDGTRTGSSCEGMCFKESTKNFRENKVDHILHMLKIIPEQIEQLKIKEKEYKDSLLNL